jgi:hypothetical protein
MRLDGYARFIAVQALALGELGVTKAKAANQEMVKMAVRPAEGCATAAFRFEGTSAG